MIDLLPDYENMMQMVTYLKKSGSLHSKVVEETLLEVDRGLFSPTMPYADIPQNIGFGQTISAPHIHALSLETLKDYVLRPASRVLDVGSGSGFLTACFSKMNPSARVFGIERYIDLVEWSKRNVAKIGVFPNLSIHHADGWEGLYQGPFDAINVGAAAPCIPANLANNLKVGGRMLIPVGPEGGTQKMLVIDRVGGSPDTASDTMDTTDFEIHTDSEVMFVPLVKGNNPS